MEYVAVDLETTGFDPGRDRVIEVGAVVFDETGVLHRLERLVDPGRAVPQAVLELTGIDPQSLAGAASPEAAMGELAALLGGRQVVGHGCTLDVDFMSAGGIWDAGRSAVDTLDLARILLGSAPSHSLPALAAELGLDQPRPHRALDDADATRQLMLHLREVAASLEDPLKESILALVAPYDWGVARFFAEALASAPAIPADDDSLVAAAGAPPGGASAARPPDDPDGVWALLAPGGPFAERSPEYELRESQRQMLFAVAQVMRRGGTLVVEAGTGTGKTLAYLLPALARAAARRERVVVSTHTQTLQEQLVGRDLPAIRDWLPWPFEARLLKGRGNYLSLRRWRRFLAEPCASSDELVFKLRILVWLRTTVSGDRSELRLHGRDEAFWARIASDFLDCRGYRCTGEDCFVHRARAEAESADLVVVNHALLLADAAQGGGILPPFQHLVVDEAHHLEDAATQALQAEAEAAGVLALLELLCGSAGEADREPVATLAPAALTAARRLFGAAEHWLDTRDAGEERREQPVRLTPEVLAGASWKPVADAAADAVDALFALDRAVGAGVARARDELQGGEPGPELHELESARARLAEARVLLQRALLEGDPGTVSWVGPHRSGGITFRSAPVDVGDVLRERLLSEPESAVFTSASLAVGGSLDYFRSRVGLEREPETLILPSPFDYLRQAIVCLPSDLPDLDTPDFELLLPEVIGDIAAAVGGRTLTLFTSHRQLRDTYDALKRRHDLDDVLILGQGIDGQRRQLLKTFQESSRPLLLGASTFWEGVDVPGDQLSCVVIVRLPFSVPADPVFAARAERLRDPFLQYALPQAALRLKQGFGRLIRRSTDRGAVVILDPRITSRRYGSAFLDALPPAARSSARVADVAAEVARWVGAAV